MDNVSFYAVALSLDGKPQGFWSVASMDEALKLDEKFRAKWGAERTSVTIRPVPRSA